MAIEVFWGSGSPFAWRVLLGLECKGLSYQSRLINFGKGDNQTPEYRAINPRGKVPVLRDGDVVLYESVAILAYLDRAYPERPLFGRTPAEAATIWRLVCEQVSYLDAPVGSLILPLYFGQVAVTEKRAQIELAAEQIHPELRRLEALAGQTPWLAGDSISAADVVTFPSLQSILRAASKPCAGPLELGFLPLNERYPHLRAWMSRVEALPGYERTYPPHWK